MRDVIFGLGETERRKDRENDVAFELPESKNQSSRVMPILGFFGFHILQEYENQFLK